MNKNHVPRFSIVIPCLNEEKYLPKLLKDLAAQTVADFEVIVVDGNSEDKTVTKATSFKKKLSLTLIPVTVRNVSFQRNTGADNSKSEWVVFMDADNRLAPDFFEKLAEQLEKSPEVEVFTTWVKVEGSSKVDKLIENSINLDIELSNLIGNTKSIGALIGMKKELLHTHKFDDTQHFMEDGKLIKELCEDGHAFKIFRNPRFYYSLRRIKKEGNIKMLQAMIKYQFHYLRGGDFSQPFSAKLYPMLGGSYYEPEKNKQRWYSSLQNTIKTASQKQLEQARRILKLLKETE